MQFLKLTLSFLFVFLIFFSTDTIAQALSKSNLSQVKVDDLSDAEILRYQQQLKASGISESQAEQIAIARGLPATEIAKLKQRLLALNAGRTTIDDLRNKQDTTGKQKLLADSTTIDTTAQKPLIDPRIFGSELFNNTSLNFEPNQRIATPMNYTLGPDDVVSITVYGLQEVTHDLTVSPEGSIYVPNVGQINVAGLSIEAATERIKSVMGKSAYPTLRNGRSKLAVTLGNIKSIKVTVIGANKPGNYTLSSISTVFNALFTAGGPTSIGSFRQIELVRNNKVIKTIDLYRFLVNGDQSDNVSLQNNDVIRIPAYKSRVELEGYVKRPGLFEVLPNESFEDVLTFASGFADSAYKASVKITQFTDREFSVKDISSKNFSEYHPQSGDKFYVDKIIVRYTNRVTISGAVYRPGFFELSPGMTLKNLIQKAEGITEDAFTGRGLIVRLKSDLSKEVIPFDVNAVINNENTSIPLQREDSVVIKSIFDLRDDYYVTIQGEVRSPGYFEYSDKLSVKDLILQAGGLTDAASAQRIEIDRLIKRDTLTRQDVRASEVIELRNANDLSVQGNAVELKPFDIVTVRRKPGYLALQTVTVTGELQYPGPYVLSKREERVSDLVKRSGGFTPEAYLEGAYIKRYNDDEERKQLKKLNIQRIQGQLSDSTNTVTEDIVRPFDQIPLNMDKILKNPGSTEDIVLKPRDELFVPKFNAQIRISGSVLFPTQIPFDDHYNLKDYISAAGGVTENAKRTKIYVLYANGKARSTRHFLFFKDYPSIKPGTEIIVPEKGERRNRLTAGETVGLASALASLAGVVIAILRL